MGRSDGIRHPYLRKLGEEYERKGTVLCFGMDPVVERMDIDGSLNLADEITRYFVRIIDGVKSRISGVKPNLGFYLQYGISGLQALSRVSEHAASSGLPVILDAKVGDIGRTSEAYARFAFDVLKADAVTLNPYMGRDALEPFFRYEDRGYYVLALTSNPGSRDFQFLNLTSTGAPLYDLVLDRIFSWNEVRNSTGAVLGATQTALGKCARRIMKAGCSIPLLIPGVGAQGGSYAGVCGELDRADYDMDIVRINASSAISYACEKYPNLKPDEAACRAVEEILSG